jgi:putative oxidoreductase
MIGDSHAGAQDRGSAHRRTARPLPEIESMKRIADPRLTAPYGAAALRIALGIVFLLHGPWLKGVVFKLPGTAAFFESIGLPGALAYVVFTAETVGGLALVLGIGTRAAALALLPVALGATWAHLDFGWLFTNDGGGYEYPLFLAAATLAQLLLGPGALRAPLPAGTRATLGEVRQ